MSCLFETRLSIVLCAAAAMSGVACAGNRISSSIPFAIEDNRVFVDVVADGQGPFGFIVDTGSNESSISETLRDRLNLTAAAAGTATGAGEATIADTETTLRSLVIGPVELGPAPVASLSYDLLRRAIGFQRLDGVVGTGLFHKYVVTFDFDNALLRLEQPQDFQPSQGAVAIPFVLSQDDMPVVDAVIAGVAGKLEIDTGDRSAVTLFGPFWRAQGMEKRVTPSVVAMTGYGIGGPIRSIVGRLPGLTIGAADCGNPVVRLSLQKAGAFARGDFAGSIGISVLKHFTATFDYARKMLYLLPRAGVEGADAYDRSGLWLGLDRDDRVIVMDLVPGGPADRARLQVGDIVTSVDDQPVSARQIFDIRRMLQGRPSRTVVIRAERAGATQDHAVILDDLITPDD